METATLRKWEYRLLQSNSLNELQGELQQAGLDGWELVNVLDERASSGPVKSLRVRRENTVSAFLKRESP